MLILNTNTHQRNNMEKQQKVSIKYNISEIFACRDQNSVMPRELEKYCNSTKKNHISALKDLSKSMDDIIKSHSYGINPDDITLKSSIRDNLNKINNSNFVDVLPELEQLVYTCENHFVLLVDELIIKCMSDVMACKGIEPSKSGHLTPSELYVNIIQKFSLLCIQDGQKLVKFKTVLTRECCEYFEKMTDKCEKMDENNPRRVSNYKGFMNMMGLLYIKGVFPVEIIKVCLQKIVKLILDSGLSQDECDNYYSGYERLVNRILTHFEKSVHSSLIMEFNEVKKFLEDFNNRISKACPSDEKQKSSSAINTSAGNSQPVVRPLRKFSTMTHHNSVARFNKLCEVFHEKEKNTKK
jgi:hypothetical protein